MSTKFDADVRAVAESANRTINLAGDLVRSVVETWTAVDTAVTNVRAALSTLGLVKGGDVS